MAFCKKCGAEGAPGTFCSSCGTKFEEVAEVCNVKVKNYTDNKNIICAEKKGCFEVLEFQKDLSVSPSSAVATYFMQEMNFKKRQLLCNLTGNCVKIQAGAMQWMVGKVSMNADVKGVGDFMGKLVKGIATGESLAKPLYSGSGYLVLEPTYNYILFEDLSEWGSGIVLSDGMFLACDASVKEEVIARKKCVICFVGWRGYIQSFFVRKWYSCS